MGYTGDIMHSIVEKELKRNYPASEGWELHPESKKIGKDEIFTLTKKRGGKNEAAFVGITFGRKIDAPFLEALMEASKSPAASRSAWHYALIAPQGVDQEGVPGSMRVIYMRAFRYEDGGLVWLKHPTQKPSAKPSS